MGREIDEVKQNTKTPSEIGSSQSLHVHCVVSNVGRCLSSASLWNTALLKTQGFYFCCLKRTTWTTQTGMIQETRSCLLLSGLEGCIHWCKWIMFISVCFYLYLFKRPCRYFVKIHPKHILKPRFSVVSWSLPQRQKNTRHYCAYISYYAN